MEKKNQVKHHLNIFILLFLIAFANVKPQEPAKNRLAILPFQSIGITDNNMEVVQSILRVEIGKHGSFSLISEKLTEQALTEDVCTDKDCAVEIGKELKASSVMGGKLAALGEKIIVQYFLVDVDLEKEILIDQLTATNIEELEVIMKRIAISVAELKSFEESAEVGVITQAESEESLRRTSNKNFGLSFGYLYPLKGYDDVEKSFVIDVRFDYEMEEMAVGMLLGVHRGFTANIYSSYLFSKSDICPYIGGGVGFHWVLHDSYFRYDHGMENNIYRSDKLHSDGFEIALHGGVRLFHTYNFQIILNIEYSFTFNDYDDRALIFTIGLL